MNAPRAQRDPYDVLGLPHGASEREIRSAWRRLVRELHPDRNPSPEAEERYREVCAAYEVLKKHAFTPSSDEVRPGGTFHGASEEELREFYKRWFHVHGEDGDSFEMPGDMGWSLWEEDVDEEEDAKLDAMLAETLGAWWNPSRYAPPSERFPLSFWNLPLIVGEALNRHLGVELLCRLALSCGAIWLRLAPTSAFLAWAASIATPIVASVFRHYHPYSVYRLNVLTLTVSVAWSALLSLMELSFTKEILFWPFQLLGGTAYFYAALFPLWAHPVIWWLIEREKRSNL